jgi:uncharacterized protein YqeY
MPTLLERLEADYKLALKAGQRRRVDALRLMKADAQRVAIEKRKERLDDQELLQVLSKQAKQRRETIEAAKLANRQDVLDQATEELAILNSYLPQQLSDAALKQLIEEAIRSAGAEATQGQVMKYVMAKAAGSADGKLVSQLVGARLKSKSGSDPGN